MICCIISFSQGLLSMTADCYSMGNAVIEIHVYGSKVLPYAHAYCKITGTTGQEQLEKSLAVLIHENSLFHISTLSQLKYMYCWGHLKLMGLEKRLAGYWMQYAIGRYPWQLWKWQPPQEEPLTVTKQGSKLRPIWWPMRLAFSPWRIKLSFSHYCSDLNFAWFRCTIHVKY